jgi:hypothetical protein
MRHSFERRWRIVRGNVVEYADNFHTMLVALDFGHEVTEGGSDEHFAWEVGGRRGDDTLVIDRITLRPMTRIAR